MRKWSAKKLERMKVRRLGEARGLSQEDEDSKRRAGVMCCESVMESVFGVDAMARMAGGGKAGAVPGAKAVSLCEHVELSWLGITYTSVLDFLRIQ